jgi:uncharacterized protein (TIGR04255 family)
MNRFESRGFPSFKKPPVIEVVCGIGFEKLTDFRANHVGLFWQKVQDEFPECEHAVRLGAASPIDLANYLPRVWFINQKQNKLIQIQDNMFFFNWRRMKETEPYPRYKTIIKSFKANFKVFQEFLKEESLGSVTPESCELTYINHIPRNEGWESLSGIDGVFRDFAWVSPKGRFLPEPRNLSGQISFPLPEDKGSLTFKLEHGKRRSDDCPLLILHNSARGLGESKAVEDVWDWFEIAHEWIVRGFADITSPKIQKSVWQRMDTD